MNMRKKNTYLFKSSMHTPNTQGLLRHANPAQFPFMAQQIPNMMENIKCRR